MSVFKRGDNWYIDYYFDGRRIKEAVSHNKKKAEQVLAVRKAEILQGKYNLKDREKEKANILFERFAKTYLEWARLNKRSYLRDVDLVKNLMTYFTGKKLFRITSLHVENYKSLRRNKVAPATVNREVACLKHMFNLAIKWEKASSNPVKGVKFFEEPKGNLRVLSKTEEMELIAASADHLKPIIITALNTGMRLREVLDFTWDRVNFVERYITVTNTKNRENRIIPMNDRLYYTLSKLKRTGDLLFCKKDGSAYGSIKTAFRRALKRSGVSYCRFHDLRHTFATRLVMKGIDLVTVKELLGHKSIEVTMRYSHPTPEHKKMAVGLLDVDLDRPNLVPKENIEFEQAVKGFT